uniref:Glycosyl transferase group 1 n=1 Tax=Sphingobacterium sp. (strain 21) TaxID=743722 RepID=F4C962_SPHS2
MKKGLHINSYYFTNKIHHNFRKHLLQDSFRGSFFIPVYKNAEKTFDDDVMRFEIYSPLDKKIFFSKIFKGFRLLRKKFRISDYSYIHCHTLISDGLIGYLASLVYKKPLIVTVRNTDINFFIPNKLFYCLGGKVLKRASHVILLSPAYEEKIKRLYPFLKNRHCFVLPNGIDDFWIENLHKGKELATKKVLRLIFVGKNDVNKNLLTLLEFLTKYDDRTYELTVVGDNTEATDFDSFNASLPNKNRIIYRGKIEDIGLLQKIYRENDIFVLLSFKETFGVSYIEAMSQGLPVVYTKGEGIDGFFEDGVAGYACEPTNLIMLKEKIDKIVDQYERLSKNAVVEAAKFSWDAVIEEYKKRISV